MPTNPNKLSQFWQELKRRCVVHVITVYASASFVIIELVNNLTEPLSLGPKLATIVVVVLAIGFPLAIILAWIYDMTPDGIEKTKASEKTKGNELAKVPNGWRIATYVSFVVIIGLLALNIVGGPKQLRAGDIQSIVILPFDNFTGDDQLDYFVEGMHASLINDMGKISGLRVICKTSASTYRDLDMTASEIAKELNVDAVVEGSIMCLGDSICSQFRLVNTAGEEKQIWNADYREEKSQILNFYNRVTRRIADEVKIELTSVEEQLFAETRTIDPQAYDAYLKGKYYWEKLDPESMKMAEEYFKTAIEIEPEWAEPYARLASVYGSFYILPKSVTLPLKYQYLNKALELDPNSALAHHVNARTAVWAEFDWDKGEKEFLKSIELNPNNALCHLYYSHLLMILRRSQESVQQAKLGLELDPLKPLVLSLYGVVMVNEGNYQSAIQHFEKALSIDPNFRFAAGNLSQAQLDLHYFNGDYEKWIEVWERKVRGYGHWNEKGIAAVMNTFHEEGHIAAIEEMFKMNEEYGNDCYMSEGIKAIRYLKLGNLDKVMDHREKIYEMRSLNAAYMATNMQYYHQLKDNARYIALLKTLNLPHDD